MSFHPAEGDAEIWAALVLGVRDYVRKCGFSKVVLGLSGGIDSALVAAIASCAIGRKCSRGADAFSLQFGSFG